MNSRKSFFQKSDEGFEEITLPTRSECLALMETYGMLPNIREHSFRVMRVATFLGRALAGAGLRLHLPLIEAAALLHDLGKTPCLGTPRSHAQWGAEVLADLGYGEVASIVKEHVFLEVDPAADPRPPGESEIVNYADKRVMHDRVVSLAERFADLKNRYGRTPEALSRLEALEVKTRGLESRLFAPLEITPLDLLHLNHIRRKS